MNVLPSVAPKETGPAPKWTGPRLELPMKALIDRAAIDAEVAQLARTQGAGSVEFRKSVVDVLARALEQGRETARRALEAKGPASPAARIWPMSKTSCCGPSIPAW